MIKAWTDYSWEEFQYWLNQDKKTVRRILKLIQSIDRNGYKCIGKPEPLRGDLSGYWSARIDEKNRLVFKVDGEVLRIVQCGTHYGDL